MRKQRIKIVKYILMAGLTFGALTAAAEEKMVVQATSAAISDIKNQIKDTQNKITDINDKIGALEDEQALAEEMIDDLNAEIINTMAAIGLKEEELAAKEEEIVIKQGEIEVTQQEYEEAKLREEQQYYAMVKRVRDMYEKGSLNYLNYFLSGEGLKGILNRLDFVEEIYSYDRQKLTEYEDIRNQVHDLWDLLELEKTQLEADKTQLETDRLVLSAQKTNLDTMLDKKKKESANYAAEIKKAKQEAAVAQKLLQQEQQQLKRLEALQAQQNSSAANGTYQTTSYTSTIEDANGSELGKKVAKYACQYIGNPYVYGGTSLTKGADCSGFVYRVYKDFNYNLPRTSYEQRSAGRSVDYSEAEPGDLICYDGHIGIYIGGGKIVHASSAKTGIKVSNAAYRTILSVRRIV